MEPLTITPALVDQVARPRGLAITVSPGKSVMIDLTSAGLPPIVMHYMGHDGAGQADLVINAPRQLRVVRGELIGRHKKGNHHEPAVQLPPRQPGEQRAGDLD